MCDVLYISIWISNTYDTIKIIKPAKETTKMSTHNTIIYQKEIQTKITKSLLDMIILQLIDQQSMHGYQIITKTRKTFGVHFGPSTIYPLLASLEQKGHLTSTWNTTTEKPRKIFTITNTGKNILKFTEHTIDNIYKTLHITTENTNTTTDKKHKQHELTITTTT
jgi:DNA-binding PadR family transcriptional regulator